jgi:anti-anti-sigma regulatory factor
MQEPGTSELRHRVEHRDGVELHVIEMPSEFIADREFEEFERLAKRITRVGTQILIDCRRVHHINSTGLGAIISAYTRAHEQGGSLKLDATGNASFRALLKRTRLDMLEDSDEEPAS